ncbi:MAG: polyprenyl synthetase family protein, partial [Pseudomonadota bacterium]
LGIAFQMADDLLDVSGDADVTGKNVGDDFRERKLTLPFIKAIAKADEEEFAFWTRTIAKNHQEPEDLKTALALLHKHGAIEDTRAVAFSWADKAKTAIATLPPSQMRDLLADLSDYVVSRIA